MTVNQLRQILESLEREGRSEDPVTMTSFSPQHGVQRLQIDQVVTFGVEETPGVGPNPVNLTGVIRVTPESDTDEGGQIEVDQYIMFYDYRPIWQNGQIVRFDLLVDTFFGTELGESLTPAQGIEELEIRDHTCQTLGHEDSELDDGTKCCLRCGQDVPNWVDKLTSP
ncbi:MAG: hypothetical protein ACYSWP_20170 [Planctomycetota bacterium]|jgi:hypothetical protein